MHKDTIPPHIVSRIKAGLRAGFIPPNPTYDQIHSTIGRREHVYAAALAIAAGEFA